MRALGMFALVGALLALGCGGAPFSTIEALSDSGSAGDVRVDAADHVADAGAAAEGGHDSAAGVDAAGVDAPTLPETGALEASTPDVGTPEMGPPCCASPTAACSWSLSSCPIAGENHGSWPSSFELYTFPAESCTTQPTPAACLCDYSCACIGTHVACPAGAQQACTSDPMGGILVSCTQ